MRSWGSQVRILPDAHEVCPPLPRLRKGLREGGQGGNALVSKTNSLFGITGSTPVPSANMSNENLFGSALETKNQPVYPSMVFFEADGRFSKVDFEAWTEGKLDKDDYKEKIEELEDRGFQEYFPQVTLTKTEFQPDAKFTAIQTKDPIEEAKKILREIETETDKKWQMEIIIETYEQNQKKMRIFIREKYSKDALAEEAKTLREHFGGKYLLGKDDNEYPHDYICWVVESLEEGMIERARIDYEQQGDKWDEWSIDFLEECLFDEINMSAKQRIKKWTEVED